MDDETRKQKVLLERLARGESLDDVPRETYAELVQHVAKVALGEEQLCAGCRDEITERHPPAHDDPTYCIWCCQCERCMD